MNYFYNENKKTLNIKTNSNEKKLHDLYELDGKSFLKNNKIEYFTYINKNKRNNTIKIINIYSARLYYCIGLILFLNSVKINHKKINKKYNKNDKYNYEDKMLFEWLNENYYQLYVLLISEEIVL